MQKKSAPGDYNWIIDYLHVDLNEASLKPVLAFLLYWNTFEARLFERNFRTEPLKAEDILISIEDSIVNDSFVYAKQRYVSPGGHLTPKFNRLGFRNRRKNEEETSDEKYVREVLLSEEPSAHDQLNAIIIIIYRIRNNLFHGEKGIQNASGQTDLLNWACRILGECLLQNEEDTKKASE